MPMAPIAASGAATNHESRHTPQPWRSQPTIRIGPSTRIAGILTRPASASDVAPRERHPAGAGLGVADVAEQRGNREGQHRRVRERRAPEVDDARRDGHQERRAASGRHAEQPAAEPVDQPHGHHRERGRHQPARDVADAGDAPDQGHHQVEERELEADPAIGAAPAHRRIEEVDRPFGPDARHVGVGDLAPAVGIDEGDVDPPQTEGDRQQHDRHRTPIDAARRSNRGGRRSGRHGTRRGADR